MTPIQEQVASIQQQIDSLHEQVLQLANQVQKESLRDKQERGKPEIGINRFKTMRENA